MIFSRKVKSSSLISTLVIALIIYISGSLLLLGLYHFKYFQINDDIAERLDNNIESAMVLALGATKINSTEAKDSLLLFEGRIDSVYISKQLWGVFPLVTIKTSYKDRSKKKTFLYGASDFPLSDATLYLADNQRPLSLLGDTYIEGKVYLPKSGLQNGFFDQREFSGKKMIEGETDTSRQKLPEIDSVYIDHFKIYSTLINECGAFIPLNSDSSNSFDHPAVIFKASSESLKNRKLSGKIIIVSDDRLEVDGSSDLTDVVLIAPFIHFKSGFSGSVQAFAVDSICVDSLIQLKYPSAVVGIGNQDTLSNIGSSIIIHNRSNVSGIVMAVASAAGIASKPVIEIKKQGVVDGLIYNEGYTHLNGKVKGALYTNFFLEKRDHVVIENLLADATIIKSRWLYMFDYFSIFRNASKHKVIKWLN